jgi:hypothetical protein
MDRADRRAPNKISWRHFFFGGRRTALRRESDRHRFSPVDRYHSRLMLLIVVLTCLSITDGFLTLFLLDNGMYEMNPVMDFLLGLGPGVFMAGKFLLTTFGVTCLVIVSNSYMFGFRVHVKRLLPVMLALYAVVILWDTYLALSV